MLYLAPLYVVCFLASCPLLYFKVAVHMMTQVSVPMPSQIPWVHQPAQHPWAVRSLFIRQNDLHLTGRLLTTSTQVFQIPLHLLILFITTLPPSTMNANGHSRLRTSLPVYLLTYGAEPFLRSCQLYSY
jgi:hypothetical protein